jgi:hypothetical protein
MTTEARRATTELRGPIPRCYPWDMDVPATRQHRPTEPQGAGDIIAETDSIDDAPRKRRPIREWSAPTEDQGPKC